MWWVVACGHIRNDIHVRKCVVVDLSFACLFINFIITSMYIRRASNRLKCYILRMVKFHILTNVYGGRPVSKTFHIHCDVMVRACIRHVCVCAAHKL